MTVKKTNLIFEVTVNGIPVQKFDMGDFDATPFFPIPTINSANVKIDRPTHPSTHPALYRVATPSDIKNGTYTKVVNKDTGETANYRTNKTGNFVPVTYTPAQFYTKYIMPVVVDYYHTYFKRVFRLNHTAQVKIHVYEGVSTTGIVTKQKKPRTTKRRGGKGNKS